MIERHDRGPVTVLEMRHGKANALDTDLLRALLAELTRLRSAPGAVVLTGNDQMFSAGVDLRWLLEQGAGHVSDLVTALENALTELVAFPRPVVAAVNGHAIAGGFVLACACDVRLLADGPAKLGLTELSVGVPFPPTALEIVRSAIGQARTRQMIYQSRLYTTAEAAARGLVDELVEAPELLERAVAEAASLGAVPAPVFELSKLQLAEPLRSRLERLGSQHERAVRREWESEETIAVIRRFVEERLS